RQSPSGDNTRDAVRRLDRRGRGARHPLVWLSNRQMQQDPRAARDTAEPSEELERLSQLLDAPPRLTRRVRRASAEPFSACLLDVRCCSFGAFHPTLHAASGGFLNCPKLQRVSDTISYTLKGAPQRSRGWLQA